MDLGLKDRVALVAASSQGLGKAVALGLAREGARLALCARPMRCSKRPRTKSGRRREPRCWHAPSTSPCTTRCAALLRKPPGVSAVSISAWPTPGDPPSKTFAETTVEDWKAGADLNLMSTVYLAREVLPGMQRAGGADSLPSHPSL